MNVVAAVDKAYGGRPVLAAARIALRSGTVHALVGENGAGKSTLVKILAGVVPADRGELVIDGATVDAATWNRRRAREAKIGIVQQHGSSAGTLSVVENAVLGAEGGPLLSLTEPARALAELGRRIGLPLDPFRPADSLGLGARQRAEIVSALYHGARLLILDEPTAVLAPVEVDGLLATLRQLAEQGTTVVIVTHKLDEVKTVADDVTVLRDGVTVATFGGAGPARAVLDVRDIASAMVGGALPEVAHTPPAPLDAPEVLVLESVSVPPAAGDLVGLAEVTLAVRGGQIVGIAGVDGNGQRELAEVIAGLLAPSAGTVRIAGTDVGGHSVAQRLVHGLAHIPEDRHHGGLVLDASVADNLALGRRDVTGRFRIDRTRVGTLARDQISALDIRPPSPQAPAGSLSGGNQQKIVIGRELTRPGLRVVLAAQPTRGVDIGAVAKIHARLRAAANGGAGVLVISADLDELLALCHRIVVLLRGRIAGEVGGDALRSPDARLRLGAMMTGAEARA